MGYYKKHQGYYRGDYYRGDLWDDIVGGLESAGSSIAQGALGGAIGKAGSWLFGATPAGRRLPPALDATQPGGTGEFLAPQQFGRLALPPPVSPTIPAAANVMAAQVMPRALRTGRVAGENTHTAFRHVDSWEVRNRRVMNPLNPRALRRAIRRGRAFQKFAMKQLRLEGVHRKVKGFKKKVGKR
jgi:hypothetical protein